MAIKTLQADVPRPALTARCYGLRGDHARPEPEKKLTESQRRKSGGPQQPRPHHQPLPRRWSQAALPHDRLPARQDRRARRRSRRSSTTRTARRASRSSTTSTARSATSSRRTASSVGDKVRLRPQRRHQAGQLAAAPAHPARHDDPQRRDAEGQGRPARPLGRLRRVSSWRRTATTRRSACPRARSAWSTWTAAPPSARSRNIEHANISPRQGRPHALARAAPAQPRRHDEPGRPPAWAAARAVRPGGRHPARRGASSPRASRRATTSAPTVHRIVASRRGHEVAEGLGLMPRSVKKGPFVDGHLTKKIADANRPAVEEGHQDLVAPLARSFPRLRRPHVRRPQRPQVRPGVRHREHGRAQARRVRADAHLPRPLGRQEGRGGACPGQAVARERTWPRPRPRRRAPSACASRCPRAAPSRTGPRSRRRAHMPSSASSASPAQGAGRREHDPRQAGRRGARGAQVHAEGRREAPREAHRLRGRQRGAEGRPSGRRCARREDDRRRRGPEDAALDAARDGPRRPHRQADEPRHVELGIAQ